MSHRSDLPTWQGPAETRRFEVVLKLIAAVYVAVVLAMISVNLWLVLTHPQQSSATLLQPEIQQAIWLSLGTSLFSSVVSLWVGTAIAFLCSRYQFWGRRAIDVLMDVPVYLPPLVIGISLLVLFRQTPLVVLDEWIGISFHVPAIILAQIVVCTAFVFRTMASTFAGISPRHSQIAETLGCSPYQAFWRILLPQSKSGLMAAAALAWARAFGEFGPILVFAGSFRGKTEVLPVSIYLELSSGNVVGAVTVSIAMVVIAASVLVAGRLAAMNCGGTNLQRPNPSDGQHD